MEYKKCSKVNVDLYSTLSWPYL